MPVNHLRLAGWTLAIGGAALALSAPPAAADPTTLRLCTGSPGRTYIKVGERLAELAPELTRGQLAIEVVPTGGSIDNMNRTLGGECDGFIAQGDALDFFTRQVNPDAVDRFRVVGELYKELALLLCREDSGIDDLDEVDGATVAAGDMGTGALATMLSLQQLEPDAYGEIKIHPANGFEGAMAVVRGEAACVFDVIAPQSDLVRTLNENETTADILQFAAIDNDDLEEYEVDGQRVYELVEFNDELYENLSTWGDPETLAISAVLAVDREFARANPQVLSGLSMLLLTGANQIQAEAYGEEKPFEED